MARYAAPPLPQQRSDFDVHMAHAAQFAAQGQVAPAIGLYRTAATTAESRGDFRSALRAYAEIVRLEGPTSDAYLKLGEMQHKSGRRREAAASLDHAAHQALLLGRVDIGLHAYRLAADAEPTSARWNNLVQWCRNLQRDDDAMRHLEEGTAQLFREEAYEAFIPVAGLLLQTRPDHVPTLRMLMRAYLQRRDLHRAAQTIQTLLESRPGDADALEHMAETFAALGRTDKAAEVVARLATTLQSMGGASRDEARRLIDRGLGWNGHNPQLQALKRSFEPPRPAAKSRHTAPRDADIPDLDLSDFVEVVPAGPDEVDFTAVRELDILEVAELTMVTQQFDLNSIAGEL